MNTATVSDRATGTGTGTGTGAGTGTGTAAAAATPRQLQLPVQPVLMVMLIARRLLMRCELHDDTTEDCN